VASVSPTLNWYPIDSLSYPPVFSLAEKNIDLIFLDEPKSKVTQAGDALVIKYWFGLGVQTPLLQKVMKPLFTADKYD
jgi:hypothetical protein